MRPKSKPRRLRAVWVLMTVAVVAAGMITTAAVLKPPAVASTGGSREVDVPMPSRAGPVVAAFIGDSYTVGAGSSSPNATFVRLVAQHEGWVAANFGSGGTGYIKTSGAAGCGLDFCPTYMQAIYAVQQTKANVVVVSGGRNDITEPRQRVSEGVRAFYAALRGALPQAEIYAVSPLWDSTAPPPALKQLAEDVRSAVSAVDGTYLDVGQPLQGHPDWVIEDGAHPNDEGYAAIAVAIEERLDRR